MGLARNALLWISENRKLREALPKYRFIRRAVSRFMPGENLEDAIAGASRLKQQAIQTVFTHLGENVSDAAEARKVAADYVEMLKQIQKSGLDTHVSVKLTHLGLDLDESLCLENLRTIVTEAEARKTMVWIDMEQSAYVDRTLAMFRLVRADHRDVGLCLQAYLFRAEKDLNDLLPLAPAIRFVKGAYKEPATIAYAKKSDVDANFFKLSKTMLGQSSSGARLVVGTHDMKLIRSIQDEAGRIGISKENYEFHLLYGIQVREQQRLASEGFRVRVLISYGTFWFPWYVRRLAERPANVWFVARKLFSS
ncbi:MAG TPA: proline dehydrogenase [Bacteroidetes bacterium]|nr:proline dehydrogenase [Bacteroidota bacterium]